MLRNSNARYDSAGRINYGSIDLTLRSHDNRGWEGGPDPASLPRHRLGLTMLRNSNARYDSAGRLNYGSISSQVTASARAH